MVRVNVCKCVCIHVYPRVSLWSVCGGVSVDERRLEARSRPSRKVSTPDVSPDLLNQSYIG